MKYISIGESCNVKYQIDKVNGSSERLFFDWIISTMNVVNTIISCNDIKEYLFPNNIIKHPEKPNSGKRLSRVILNNLPGCIFMHDLDRNVTLDKKLVFIDGYVRRWQRIINLIKSNEKICFIRYGDVKENEKIDFINNIKKINSKCNFLFVNIQTEQKYNTCTRSENYIKICLTNKSKTNNWKGNHINWKNIFNMIEK